MRTIYLDHAATSFPKPPAVGKRMQEYVETVGATVNRSSYGAAQEAGMVALRLRQRLGALSVSYTHLTLPTNREV